jgi:hypothetical protein
MTTRRNIGHVTNTRSRSLAAISVASVMLVTAWSGDASGKSVITYASAGPSEARSLGEIRFPNVVASPGFTARPAANRPAAAASVIPTGTLSILDTETVNSGIMTSSAIGSDGLPILAYRVTVNNRFNLRVAHCSDVACTAITTADIDVGGSGGLWPSIKIGSDGLPLISYVAYRDHNLTFIRDLKVAHCNDIACTAATVTTIDAPARVDKKTSLTIGGDGLGLISYLDTTPIGSNGPSSPPFDRVKVAHCLNIACTSAKLTYIVTVKAETDSMFDRGHATIATGANGLGVIAYYSANTSNTAKSLRVAVCTNADCSTSSKHNVVDQATNPPALGQLASVTVGLDGLPLITYVGGEGLGVAHCTNPMCTESTKTNVDTGFVGATSIAIGSDGLGVISYYSTGLDLKVAHCTNVTCGAATTSTVDTFGDVGDLNSIAVGADGLPLISYVGPGLISPNALRVIHCGSLDCTAPIITPF